MIVYAVVDDALSPDFSLGDALEVFVHREDAEQFIEEVRGDDPEVAEKLRVEERDLRAGNRLALRMAVMKYWDPIGVSDQPLASDEYDNYLDSIERELRHGSVDTLAHYLYEVTSQRMGLGRTKSEECDSARALFAWWELEAGGLN